MSSNDASGNDGWNRPGSRFPAGAKKRAIGVALAGSLAVLGATGGIAAAQTGQDSTVPKLTSGASPAEACRIAFGGEKAFAQAPSEGNVGPGERLSLDVAWGTDWKRDSTVDVLACTALDGKYSNSLSVHARNERNDGLFVHEFTVPKNIAKGARICQRTIVLGESPSGQPKAERLEADCFTVAGAKDTAPAREAVPADTKREAAAGPGPEAPPSRPAEAPAAASTPTPSDVPPDAGTTAARAPAAASAPALANLPRTGPRDDASLLAGALLALGGFAVALGRPLRRARVG